MPGKYISDEEKASILAWKQENMPTKVICERSESNNHEALSWRQKGFQIKQFPSISMVEEENEQWRKVMFSKQFPRFLDGVYHCAAAKII